MRVLAALPMVFVATVAIAHPGHPTFDSAHAHSRFDIDLLALLGVAALLAVVITGVSFWQRAVAKR